MGRYSKWHFASWISLLVSAPLWKEALSITRVVPGARTGNKTFFSQVLNTQESQPPLKVMGARYFLFLKPPIMEILWDLFPEIEA